MDRILVAMIGSMLSNPWRAESETYGTGNEFAAQRYASPCHSKELAEYENLKDVMLIDVKDPRVAELEGDREKKSSTHL